jgi:hypothetical protein
MRNLEKQIAEWRRTMAKASDRPELLDELEEHLREEIDRLVRSGVSANDAFQIAVSKLGAPSAVAAEYEKLTSSRRVWWPIKAARVGVLAGVLLMGAMFIWRKVGLLLVSHVVCVGVGYLAMFAIGGLGMCYICAQWVGRPGPTQRHALLRSIFYFANLAAILTPLAVILGMIWAKENWGRYWAWDPKETGAFLVILSAVLVSALHWFKVQQMTTVFFGILGSAITACAWFGTIGGALSLNPLLVAFLVPHILFLISVPSMRLLKKDLTAGT